MSFLLPVFLFFAACSNTPLERNAHIFKTSAQQQHISRLSVEDYIGAHFTTCTYYRLADIDLNQPCGAMKAWFLKQFADTTHCELATGDDIKRVIASFHDTTNPDAYNAMVSVFLESDASDDMAAFGHMPLRNKNILRYTFRRVIPNVRGGTDACGDHLLEPARTKYIETYTEFERNVEELIEEKCPGILPDNTTGTSCTPVTE